MYSQIYLDYNATTPCDKKVVEAMLPYFTSDFGNASSSHHAYGWLAKDALEEATQLIAGTLNISPKEIVYTSGATESINTVIKGVHQKATPQKRHIITLKTEHKATLDVCHFLAQEGALINYLDVDKDGLINLDTLEEMIDKNTLMVIVMYANNETGVIQPLEEISTLCRKKGVFLFSDATQALGKISMSNFFKWVDFACFSAHKIYGPKGVGFTYIKTDVQKKLNSFIQGGGQQRNLRGGTYNIPSIVGFAHAVELSHKIQESEKNRLEKLRDLLALNLAKIEAVNINAQHKNRLPNTLNISFGYVDGEQLLRALSKYLAVSNGSACNSASVNPSHVLIAMGVKRNLAFASLRFSLGRFTTEDDIQKTITIITKEVALLRSNNILWERRR